MRHHKAFRKLGRTPAHRRAVLRNLATSLVLNERIETTLAKAKDLRRVADKLVTLGKKGDLHARRNAMRYLFAVNRHEKGSKEKLTPVHKLFTDLAERYAEREGGYTRVVRTRRRPGDNAQLAIIEFVEESLVKKVKERRRRVRRAEEIQNVESTTVEASAEVATDETESSSSES